MNVRDLTVNADEFTSNELLLAARQFDELQKKVLQYDSELTLGEQLLVFQYYSEEEMPLEVWKAMRIVFDLNFVQEKKFYQKVGKNLIEMRDPPMNSLKDVIKAVDQLTDDEVCSINPVRDQMKFSCKNRMLEEAKVAVLYKRGLL